MDGREAGQLGEQREDPGAPPDVRLRFTMIARRTLSARSLAAGFLVLLGACQEPDQYVDPPFAWLPSDVYDIVYEMESGNPMPDEPTEADYMLVTVDFVRSIEELDLSELSRDQLGVYELEWLEGLPGLRTLKLNLMDMREDESATDVAGFRFVRAPSQMTIAEPLRLPSLEVLEIRTNAMQRLAAFARAPKLRELTIISMVHVDLSDFRRAKSLRKVVVESAHGPHDVYLMGAPDASDMRRFEELEQLETLDVSGLVSPDNYAPLADLPNLKHLIVSVPLGTQTDGLEQLTQLRSLEIVDSESSPHCDGIVERLKDALPSVRLTVVSESSPVASRR